MHADFLIQLRDATLQAERARAAVNRYLASITSEEATHPAQQLANHGSLRQDVYDGLAKVSQRLADGYAQAYVDLENETRISYAGTAHEIREVLATLLRELAPNDEVKADPNYKPEPNTTGPTQKQRVLYILRKHRAGSKAREVAEEAAEMENWIGNVARATYSRGSDAAHRGMNRTEVVRIMHYFEALARDLLNLD